MKPLLGFLIVILRIYIVVKVTILLYSSRNGFTPELLNSSLWWGLTLIFDIWIQFTLPVNKDDDEVN